MPPIKILLKYLLMLVMVFSISVQSVYADADNGKNISIKKPNNPIKNSNDITNTVKLSSGRNRMPEAVDMTKLIQGNTPETQYINLSVNKAAILRLPRPSRDVIVANPALMDLVVRSPQELYLFAKTPGQTNAFIFDEAGRQIVNLEINIGIDTKDLERIFKEQIPDSNINITSMGSTIILSGTVKNATYAKMARDIAQRMTEDPENVLNNIGVTGQEQVMIKVKVAEMQRTILKQLGIDWNTAFKVGQLSGGLGLVNGFGANGPPATGLVGTALNGSNIVSTDIGGLPSFASDSAVQTYIGQITGQIGENTSRIEEVNATIRGMQEASIAPAINPATGLPTGGSVGLSAAQQQFISQISAEIVPLQAANGRLNNQLLEINNQLTNTLGAEGTSRQRTAGYASENLAIDSLLKALERHSLLKTLAEPNLTALSGESAKFLAGGELPYLVSQTFGQASVDFKPYGIGLAFTPTVLNDERISLRISTEISEIGESVTAGNSSYPGLSVRRAETTVEMPSGGTMAMAGLIRDDTRRSIDSTPGIKEMPVLGPLFRSNDFQTKQSELVVLVTPYLAKPAHESDFSLPTDGFANPSDMDMYLKGRLNAVYDEKEEAKAEAESATGKKGISGMIDSWFSPSSQDNKNTASQTTNSDEYILE